MTTESEWITASRAAKALGRKHTTIKRWARYGLQHRMDGQRLLVRIADVEAFASARVRRTPFTVRVADDPSELGVVYAWKHPQTGEIRYVGKAKDLDDRLKHYRHKVHSPHLRSWMESLRRDGLEPALMILEECKGWLSQRERWWIAHGRACGWKLINKTDGGDGGAGMTDDVRAVLSEKSKAKWQDPEYVKRWRESMAKAGMLLTDERKQQRKQRAKVDALIEVAWRAWVEPVREAERRRRQSSAARLGRSIVIDGEIARVPLTRGEWALIDRDDAERVGRHRWSLQIKGRYLRAKTNIRVGDKKQLVLLSRFVARANADDMVRHRNGRQLDCMKANLVVSRAKIGVYELAGSSVGRMAECRARDGGLLHGCTIKP